MTSHTDEARRIVERHPLILSERTDAEVAEIAAALAAAERRGIERLRPALEQFDIDYYCEEGQPESEACRYAPSVLADAIRALLPAEPAAKCARCNGSGVTSAPYEFDAEDCPSCGGAR